MWLWIVSSITGSILGEASANWFEKTRVGRWFYKKVNNYYNWAAGMLGLEVLKAEDKWRKKYPHIATKIDKLEQRINKLEKINLYRVNLSRHPDKHMLQ